MDSEGHPVKAFLVSLGPIKAQHPKDAASDRREGLGFLVFVGSALKGHFLSLSFLPLSMTQGL